MNGVLHVDGSKCLISFLILVILFDLIIVPIVEAQFEYDYYFGKRARKNRKKRIKRRQKIRKKTMKKELGKKAYKKVYGKKGVFPRGFGLLGNGKGTLGLRGLGGGRGGGGGGGFGGGGRRGGFGGYGAFGTLVGGGGGGGGRGGGFRGVRQALFPVRIATNVAGRLFDVSDRLGDDLIGPYGLLTVGGLDDFTFGAFGDALFSPGAALGLGPGGRSAVAGLGLASGPARASWMMGKTFGLKTSEMVPMVAASTLSNFGSFGAPGVALAALTGGLAGFSAEGGFLDTALGAGYGAALSSSTTPFQSIAASTGAAVGNRVKFVPEVSGALSVGGAAGSGSSAAGSLGSGVGSYFGRIYGGKSGSVIGANVGLGLGNVAASFTGTGPESMVFAI